MSEPLKADCVECGTEAELDAFMKGVEECDGWLAYTVVDEPKGKPTYEELIDLLARNQSAWEDEEDSVKEEHEDLIADNEAMLERSNKEGSPAT